MVPLGMKQLLNPMASIENEIIGIIFIFLFFSITISSIFNWKRGGGGVLWNFFDGGVRLRFSNRIPLAKDILVENIPLAKDNFLIMSPFLNDFKEFQPKYSLFKFSENKTLI